MGNSTPIPNLMNGWDYVLAITQDQVNNGFRIAYEGGYVGTGLPRMPKEQFTLSLDTADSIKLVANFGCPSMHAKEDALKQCDLMIPLHNASVLDRGVSKKLPSDACLVITTALACTTTSVTQGDPRVSGSSKPTLHHDVFVDFNSPQAIFNVRLEDPALHELKPRVAIALTQKLRALPKHTFRVASFDAPPEANPFVPCRVDACFVRNAGQTGRTALVFAASLDTKGALKTNQLEFASAILPLDVPAALWVSPRLVLGTLILPMIRNSLKNGPKPPDMCFDESSQEIRLVERYRLPDVSGKMSVMERLRIYVSDRGGSLGIESDVRVYGVASFRNAIAHVQGSIGFGLCPQDASVFLASYSVADPKVDIENTMPKWKRWLIAICTLGYAELVNWFIDLGVGVIVFPKAELVLNDKLKDSACKINDVTRRIPALETLAAGGHLVFRRVDITRDGVLLGICATSPPPRAAAA